MGTRQLPGALALAAAGCTPLPCPCTARLSHAPPWTPGAHAPALLPGAGGDLAAAAAAAAAFGPVSAFDFAGLGTFAEDMNDDVGMLDSISLELMLSE
jgi:hypothetical protein